MKAAIKAWLINNGFDDEFLCNYQEVGGIPEGGTVSQVIEGCMADIGLKWIGVDDELPDCIYEHSSWGHDGDVCEFDGMVSQSVEVTDGQNWARAHYQSDGVWHIYDVSQHDFLNVDPEEVTHWMPMVKLPGH